MDWESGRESSNVEDLRGISPTGLAIGGGGIGAVILVVLFLVFGGDPSALFQRGFGGRGSNQRQVGPGQERTVRFVKVILASTEDVWTEQFQQMGWGRYRDPKLVLFNGQVRSACGFASAAVGPFYCPADHRVYLDLNFFDELSNKFQAPGDFANAYVIAHEVGHHVQNLRGISARVSAAEQRARQGGDEAGARRWSVKLELQADFLAGVWGYHAKEKFQILQGDRRQALKAAYEIGDDRLQRRSKGYVVPDSFTHGSSQQRTYWFNRGFQSGDPSLMDEVFEQN